MEEIAMKPKKITKTYPSNADRCEKALIALQKAKYIPGDELSAGITDLIADLLHLAHQNGVEPDYVIRTAPMHYDAEVAEEAGK
jgi:hypothetical protein